MQLIKRTNGFSLIELAIVLTIISLLLGTIGIPIYQQRIAVQRQSTQAQLKYIDQRIQQFFLINMRLPCPSDHNSAGIERFSDAQCSVLNGFVPSVTLGLTGTHNADLLLLDAWHNPIRYSVSDAEHGLWFDAERIRSLTDLHVLSGNLRVCIRHDGCGNDGLWLTQSAPYILLSLGKLALPSGADQQENAGEHILYGRTAYHMNADHQFVMRPFDQHSEMIFDDLLHWNSPFTFRSLVFKKNLY